MVVKCVRKEKCIQNLFVFLLTEGKNDAGSGDNEGIVCVPKNLTVMDSQELDSHGQDTFDTFLPAPVTTRYLISHNLVWSRDRVFTVS